MQTLSGLNILLCIRDRGQPWVRCVCVSRIQNCASPASGMLLHTHAHTLMFHVLVCAATCSEPYSAQQNRQSRKSTNMSQLMSPKHFFTQFHQLLGAVIPLMNDCVKMCFFFVVFLSHSNHTSENDTVNTMGRK